MIKIFRTFYLLKPLNMITIGTLLLLVSLMEGIGLSMVIPVFEKMYLKESNKITSVYLDRLFNFIGVEDSLTNIFVLVISLFVFKSVFSLFVKYLVSKYAADFLEDYQAKCISIILRAELRYFNSKKISDLINVLINEAQRASASYIYSAQWLSFAMSLILYTVIAYMVADWIAFVAMALGVIVLSPLKLLTKRNRKYGQNLTKQNENLNLTILENFNAYKVIKAFGLEERTIKRIQNTLRSVSNSWQKVYFHSNSLDIYSQPLVVFILCAILFMAKKQGASFGEVILFLVAFQRLLPAFTQMISVHNNINMTMPGFDAIDSLLKEGVSFEELKGGGEPLPKDFTISFEDVRFKYSNSGELVLKGVSFEARPSKVTALVGRSGSGKTTIVDILLGFYKAQSGSVKIGGIPLENLNLNEFRHNLAYVTQEHFIFNGTIRENILWGLPNDEEVDLDSVLELSNCNEFVEKLEDGIDTVVGDRGTFLSGGQKQRISLARAIVRKPSILLLDEATSALDYIAERAVTKTIKYLKENKEINIIVIAHRMDSVRDADNILVLDNGKISEKGDWKTLSKNPEGYIGKSLVAEEETLKK
jgi:ABC-type multidrug transport system fused ATPase/permease subunit